MKTLRYALIALFLTVVLAACGAQAPTEPGEVPPGLETPGAEDGAGEGQPVTIVIWHGYIETEERLLTEAIASFHDANPNITVEALAVPFTELQNKFQTEAAAGAGPTLITGPQDRMAAYASAGLLAPIPEDAAFMANVQPEAVDGGRVNGELLGAPLNNKVLGLFYNRSIVEAPPATMSELLALAEEHGLATTRQWFHNYMWLPAFGASLFDENYRCVLDETGAAEAFAYVNTLCDAPGVVCDQNDGDMDTLFRSGEVAFRIQGPWMSADAVADLGAENVGVGKIPTVDGEADPRPWNQVEVISLSVNATEEEQQAALAFIEHLTSAEVQGLYLNEANWIPVNPAVDASMNPVVAGFLEQVPFSDPFPVAPELAATWEPLDNALGQVVEDVAPPEQAVADACMLINTTNNK